MEYGCQEQEVFVQALHIQDEAREWQMKNGHSHLMALIHGVEGNPYAVL